jgi:hypothetical protein
VAQFGNEMESEPLSDHLHHIVVAEMTVEHQIG